jgi:hypothetical protein
MTEDPVIRTLNSELRSPKQKTVIVFGVGRGGTSAVAGVLRELGVVMPGAHPLKHEWSPVCYHGDGSVDAESTSANLRHANKLYDIWGWKSPKDAFCFDQFQSYVRNPVLVIIYRNLLDAALSGARYGEFDWEICMEDYAAAQAQLSKIIKYNAQPIVVLGYERLVREPAGVIKLWRTILLTLETCVAGSATKFDRHHASRILGREHPCSKLVRQVFQNMSTSRPASCALRLTEHRLIALGVQESFDT